MHASAICVLVALTVGQREYRDHREFRSRSPGNFAQELKTQQESYRKWWGTELVTRLADLPTASKLPDYRVPYAGHDYPDMIGGTVKSLAKYDQAFHGGQARAAEHERNDIAGHRNTDTQTVSVRRGLFRRSSVSRPYTPHWYGHCNGWTAASIRHAEPQRSVKRNGVVFTPADIKGMLAEMYMYSATESLGGSEAGIHPAILHLTLTNWLGRQGHPVGCELAPGKTVINYPIYSYRSDVRRVFSRQVDVMTTVTYRMNTPAEQDKSPDYHRQTYFQYALELNERGEIVGGSYTGGGARADLFWVAVNPAQGGQEGNTAGNPYLDVKEVLSIWRESVPEDLRKKWVNIDAPPEDRALAATPMPGDKAKESGAESGPVAGSASSTSAQ